MHNDEKTSVLMVDDHPQMLSELERILDSRGLHLVKATSGGQALSLLREQDFALVILDVQMPEMTGFEVAEHIQSIAGSQGTPIIFMTADQKEHEHVVKGYECGGVDYLFKPIDEHALRSKVAVFTELHRQRRALEREVARRESAEEALRESEQRFRLITELTSDFVYFRNAMGAITYASPACAEVTGYAAATFLGDPDLLDRIIHEDDRAAWQEHGRDVEAPGPGSSLELRIVRRDGAVRWISHTCRPAYDAQGRLTGVRASNRDISKMKELETELTRLSYQDALTGVANRRYFDSELGSEWRRAMRMRSPISLVMVDIDHFKAFNDHYGHQEGDKCLQAVASTLAGIAKRARELVARYGGEEFAVVLLGVSLEDSAALAGQMRSAVEVLDIAHEYSPVSDHLTISLGVAAAVPPLESEPDILVAAADQALYRAKAEGRNRVETAGPVGVEDREDAQTP